MNQKTITPAATEAQSVVYELSANGAGSDLELITLTAAEFEQLKQRLEEIRGL